MKILKITLISLLSVFLIISPLLITVFVAVFTEPQFDESFVGVLDGKLERLEAIEEDKIIVVGGSSVAFGVMSPLIEEYTEMPVVNFGLYASLGTRLMLDLSRHGVKEGDIVILAPEMDAQTLSLYFNSDRVLEAMDGSLENLRYVDSDNIFSVFGAMWGFAEKKLSYISSGTPPKSDGVYSAESFNEYLDIEYPREYNIMHSYYDKNLPILLDESIVSDDFIDYLNDYIAYCRRCGAEVYFSWCPMNELAVINESRESVLAFEEYMKSKIDCTFISNIEDYILPPEYFYDTNFHVNDAGMLRHSVDLTKDILFELGIPRLVEAPEGEIVEGLVTVPHPELPFSDVRWFDYDENEIYFEYAQAENGAYTVIGLTELGLQQKSLTLPKGAESYVVTAIARGAFEGSSLEELIIPEGTELKIMMNGCFEGASSLKRLVIYHQNEEDILPPFDFKGVAEGFTVYIPEGSNYESGYYWGERNLNFERIEK